MHAWTGPSMRKGRKRDMYDMSCWEDPQVDAHAERSKT